MKITTTSPRFGMDTGHASNGKPDELQVRQSPLQPSSAKTELASTISTSPRVDRKAGKASSNDLNTLIAQFNTDESTNIMVGDFSMAMTSQYDRDDAPYDMTKFWNKFYDRRDCHVRNRQEDVEPNDDTESYDVTLMHPTSKNTRMFFGTSPRSDDEDNKFYIHMGFILRDDVKIKHAFPAALMGHSDHQTTAILPSMGPSSLTANHGEIARPYTGKPLPLKATSWSTSNDYLREIDKHFKIIDGTLTERSNANTLAALKRFTDKHNINEKFTSILVAPSEDPNQFIQSFFIDLFSDVPPMNMEKLNQVLAENKDEVVEFKMMLDETRHFERKNKAGEVEFDVSIDAVPLTVIYNDIASGRRKIAYLAFDQNGTPVANETPQLDTAPVNG